VLLFVEIAPHLVLLVQLKVLVCDRLAHSLGLVLQLRFRVLQFLVEELSLALRVVLVSVKSIRDFVKLFSEHLHVVFS